MKSLHFVYLLIQIFAVAAQPSEDPEHAKEFIPTNEWQTISEGQEIPPGLHVRLNLETGLREAKVLDNNEQKSTSNEIIAVSPEAHQEEISRKNLEKAFANLDLSKDDVQSDETHEEDIRQRFRSYDELKKEFESLNMKIQTDQEILVTLIDQLNKTDNDDNTKTILTDLEYYLHQYDNAVLFADMNGLDLLVALLNSTNTDAEIRKLTSLALGAAFQGNPKVQLKALQSDCIQHLLHLLNIESDDNIILRLLFALSTLLRNFPPAQKTFLEHGGAELMIKMFDLNNKIAVRTITLMNDLITEKKKMKKKAQRATSNVFSMFDQKQVQEFKEAFNLMDQDRDGTVSMDDLKEVYASLGKAPKDAELKAMLDEAQGPVNFTTILSLFGDRLNGTDEENVILNAWKNFDKEGTGFINQKNLREVLTSEGRPDDRLTDMEFSQMLDGAPIDPKGNLDYAAFTRQIKRGKEDE
ncbi:unnamed protein product [Rotaria magnacalcarata]|uniref:EF-hand domain-containing protein n=2 Tax=Rotaria magnacalcarata TaxID=392030 RepID=A0A8S2NHB0_9BILA|nr:unnamed protein product [Rotaria magnacalcarata]